MILRLEPLDRRDVPTAVPVGLEFVTNTAPGGSQDRPAVAMDGGGNFTVVWQSMGQDGSNNGVYGQRYAVSGAKLGGEFQANTFTFGAQQTPQAAADVPGNVVVVWSSASAQDGSRDGIFLQAYTPSGAKLGTETQVNTWTPNIQSQPAVAVSANGQVVVTWMSLNQDGDRGGIYAQRYTIGGTGLVAQGAEFPVNTATTGDQKHPAVTIAGNGNFTIAWEGPDDSTDQNSDLFAQRFAANGTKIGTEFKVNSTTLGDQLSPKLAIGTTGNLVVAWQSDGQTADTSGWAVVGQRYDASGVPQGGEFLLNTATAGDQTAPQLVADAGGNFVAVWETSDGDGQGLHGQRFSAGGAKAQTEFTVNATTAADQDRPGLGGNAGGDFVAAWRGSATAATGVVAQRFAVPPPPRAAVQYDLGGPQRSMIRSITLAFNTLVTINPSAISVTKQGGTTVPFTFTTVGSTFTNTVAKLSFAGSGLDHGSLSDGYYTLAIAASGVQNYDGITYDANGDGVSGDGENRAFHRLVGDVDGDTACDGNDLAALAGNFNTLVDAVPVRSGLDLDNDEAVDGNDLAILAFNFNRTL